MTTDDQKFNEVMRLPTYTIDLDHYRKFGTEYLIQVEKYLNSTVYWMFEDLINIVVKDDDKYISYTLDKTNFKVRVQDLMNTIHSSSDLTARPRLLD